MNNLSKNNVQYNMIDVMRLVMAFVVIMLHKPFIPPSNPFPKFIVENIIGSTAVPFFFMVSSFLFFKKIGKGNDDRKVFLNYEKRLLILYTAWTIIYIPSNLIKYYGVDFNGMTFKLFVSALFQIVRNFFLSTSFVHLWYVNTLIVALAAVYFMRKRLSRKLTLIISLIFFGVSNLMPILYTYLPFIEKIWTAVPVIILNVCQKGLLCVAIGMFMSDFRECNKRSEILFVIVGFVAMVGFSAFTYEKRNTLVETVSLLLIFICSASIFLLCRDIKLKNSRRYKIIRSYSSIIYFSHLLMMGEIFKLIEEKTGMTAFTQNRILIYFTTASVAIIISTLMIILSKKQKFKWLKYLY